MDASRPARGPGRIPAIVACAVALLLVMAGCTTTQTGQPRAANEAPNAELQPFYGQQTELGAVQLLRDRR